MLYNYYNKKNINETIDVFFINIKNFMMLNIKEDLFHLKESNTLKIFCNMCESSFVKYSSNHNLKRHYIRFHKQELDNYEISNALIRNDQRSDEISNVLTRNDQRKSDFNQEERNSVITSQSGVGDLKYVLSGFKGKGKIDVKNSTIEFEGEFS